MISGGLPVRSRNAALDGLRAVAILGVLGVHGASALVPGGHLGVTVFFVLSGYLITTLLMHERESTGGIDFRRFYLRRATRLLPAFVLVVLAAVPYFVLRDTFPTRSVLASAAASLLYVTNLGAAYWHGALMEPFQWAWSLSLEEQFYFLWPAILVWTWARGHRRAAVVFLAGGVALAALLRFLLPYDGEFPTRVYFAPETRADALLVGCLLAFALHRETVRSRLARYGTALTVGGLAVVGVSYLSAQVAEPSTYRYWLPLVTLASAAAIAGVVAGPTGSFARMLALGPVVWLGRISYGVYLWNAPLYLFVRKEVSPHVGGVGDLLLWAALVVAVPAMSFYRVEQPLLDRMRRQRRPDELLVYANREPR